MKRIFVLTALLTTILCCRVLQGQENTFHITVLAYQWATTHRTLTFTWPGYANTSCNGSVSMNGYASGAGNFSANGTTSNTCSTSYTPPNTQNIDVQKPVVYILADSQTSRMVLTCTRNVRWSQCHALNLGQFVARLNDGHFEVQGLSGKGKEEWVRYDIVQQNAISREQPQTASVTEAPASIEVPKSDGTNSNSGFPSRWKSMNTGTVRALRFEGDYIYAEVILPEASAKLGVFSLTDTKKDGDKYVGKTNVHVVQTEGGAACSTTWPIEFTLITPDRIEGRSFTPPPDAKIDWKTCVYTPPEVWQSFVWIPVK